MDGGEGASGDSVRDGDAVDFSGGQAGAERGGAAADGKVSFVQQKMLLPFYDVFDEQRYFEPAAEQTLTCCGWAAAGDYDLRGCVER